MNEKTQPCTHCGAVHPRVNLTWMGSAELCPECLQRYTVCNDEGKLLQLPPNRWLWGGQDLLVGPAFIAAGDEEGNLCSLSDAMLEKYTNLFKEPMFLAW